MSWLAGLRTGLCNWWALVWFCFLFSVSAPSCSLLSPPTGEQKKPEQQARGMAGFPPPKAAR